jgi:predicted ATP-grasp superfamily ATP-dependent carboligase
LAVVRSLGKRGLRVIAMTNNRNDCGVVSKYVSETVWCPHPKDEEALVEFLISHKAWHGALLLESDDYYAVVLSKYKQRLSEYYTIATPDWDILATFVEKRKTYALAAACGIPHPQTFEPQTFADIEAIQDSIQLPCIIKPVHSHEFVARFQTKAFVIDTLEQLQERLAQCVEEGHPVIVQEIIPGGDDAFERVQVYIDSRGEILAELYNEKIRQSPPIFGVMRVGKSVPRNLEVQELTYRLLAEANYRGYCSVEYKRDPRDQQLKLIEANIRMPRSGWLAISSGVDIPWLIYKDLVENEQICVDTYQETIWIEIVPDVLNTLVRDGASSFSLREFVRPYLSRNKAFAVFSLSDPRPFLKQIGGLTQQARKERTRKKNHHQPQTQVSGRRAD